MQKDNYCKMSMLNDDSLFEIYLLTHSDNEAHPPMHSRPCTAAQNYENLAPKNHCRIGQKDSDPPNHDGRRHFSIVAQIILQCPVIEP